MLLSTISNSAWTCDLGEANSRHIDHYEALQTALNEQNHITAELHTVVVGSRGGFSHGNLATLIHLGKFVSDATDALLVPRAAATSGRALHLIAARASGALVACRTAADQELFHPSKKKDQPDGAAPASTADKGRRRTTGPPASQQPPPPRPPQQQQQPTPPGGSGPSTAAAAAEATFARFAAGRGGTRRPPKRTQPPPRRGALAQRRVLRQLLDSRGTSPTPSEQADAATDDEVDEEEGGGGCSSRGSTVGRVGPHPRPPVLEARGGSASRLGSAGFSPTRLKTLGGFTAADRRLCQGDHSRTTTSTSQWGGFQYPVSTTASQRRTSKRPQRGDGPQHHDDTWPPQRPRVGGVG